MLVGGSGALDGGGGRGLGWLGLGVAQGPVEEGAEQREEAGAVEKAGHEGPAAGSGGPGRLRGISPPLAGRSGGGSTPPQQLAAGLQLAQSPGRCLLERAQLSCVGVPLAPKALVELLEPGLQVLDLELQVALRGLPAGLPREAPGGEQADGQADQEDRQAGCPGGEAHVSTSRRIRSR